MEKTGNLVNLDEYAAKGHPKGPDECAKGNGETCALLEEVRMLREKCERLLAENEHLRLLSQTDPLTGIYNFRHLQESLAKEMERARRSGVPVSVIMIDLDHFKLVNDTHGHQAGDEVLKTAGRIWKENIRQIDILCRYGGEEFCIILPGTRLRNAVKAAERLRRALEEAVTKFERKRITVTASFGVDSFLPGDGRGVSELLEGADQFLLRAKTTGRNRVCSGAKEIMDSPLQVSEEERAALFVGRWPVR